MENCASDCVGFSEEDGRIKKANGICNPLYLIAVATNVELPKPVSGIFEEPINQSEVVRSLSSVVSERDAQIGSLNQAVADRDAQVGSLNQAVAERDAQIGSLNHEVVDRDGQIASLQQVVGSLNQTVTERDAHIGLLNEAVAARDAQFEGLFQSRKLADNSAIEVRS